MRSLLYTFIFLFTFTANTVEIEYISDWFTEADYNQTGQNKRQEILSCLKVKCPEGCECVPLPELGGYCECENENLNKKNSEDRYKKKKEVMSCLIEGCPVGEDCECIHIPGGGAVCECIPI